MLALVLKLVLVAVAWNSSCIAMEEDEPNDEAIVTNKKQNLVSNVAGYSLKTHLCFL